MSVYIVTGGKVKVTDDFTEDGVSKAIEWREVPTPDGEVLDFAIGLTGITGEVRIGVDIYRCDNLTADEPQWYLVGRSAESLGDI